MLKKLSRLDGVLFCRKLSDVDLAPIKSYSCPPTAAAQVDIEPGAFAPDNVVPVRQALQVLQAIVGLVSVDMVDHKSWVRAIAHLPG